MTHTPGPWLTDDGRQWLVEPQRLLANTADALLMGRAPDLLAALQELLESHSATIGVGQSMRRIKAKQKARVLIEALSVKED